MKVYDAKRVILYENLCAFRAEKESRTTAISNCKGNELDPSRIYLTTGRPMKERRASRLAFVSPEIGMP